ncbi:MAG TPA: RluA family pseudouridine synthase [Candidatus Caenarcaniphilales bacterium]|nr:RluA family pseudouridine synthase [Candidatus Caenarcaniphilales bacterium]
MSERVTVTVPAGARSQRADRVVADAAGMSRSQIQRLIEDGRLTLEGRQVKANTVLPPGAQVTLDLPEPTSSELHGEDIPLNVVYEDDDVLIIDKPSGLMTHPAPGQDSGTLVNALLARGGRQAWGNVGGADRPGIVHRLDRDTSGLLIVARNDHAQRALMAQLKARRVKKTYLGLVAGQVPAEIGRIEAPIGRDPRHPTRMAVAPDGRPATTGYRVGERFDRWTLLELDLLTGRTHQLRVHLASIGHPIAGDPVYGTGPARRGPDRLERLFLHSWRIEFAAVAGDRIIRAEAPLPAALEAVLADLRVAERGLPQ